MSILLPASISRRYVPSLFQRSVGFEQFVVSVMAVCTAHTPSQRTVMLNLHERGLTKLTRSPSTPHSAASSQTQTSHSPTSPTGNRVGRRRMDLSPGFEHKKDDNVEPWACVCGQRFKKGEKDKTPKSNLFRHIKESNEGKTYKCPHCNHTTVRKWNLGDHIKTRHKDLPQVVTALSPSSLSPPRFGDGA